MLRQSGHQNRSSAPAWSAFVPRLGKNPCSQRSAVGLIPAVATAMVQRAVGQQLAAVFVDTGLLRLGEVAQVQAALHENLGVELVVVDAVDQFMQGLRGVVDPEQKRRIIGELFIRLFEDQARQLGLPRFLVQGTIYPDVVRIQRARSGEGSAHQDAPQCRRPTGGYGV